MGDGEGVESWEGSPEGRGREGRGVEPGKEARGEAKEKGRTGRGLEVVDRWRGADRGMREEEKEEVGGIDGGKEGSEKEGPT